MDNETPLEFDVLDALNRRTPTGFYWSLSLLATIGGFLFGYDTANIGSALNFIPFPLHGFAMGYLVASTSIGAAVGAFFAGPLTDRFGRKSMLIIDAGVYAAGAILSAVAWQGAVLLTARTLIGLAIGADSAIATAYISEYAPSGRRGALSFLQQWMITVGILISYIIAMIVLNAMPGKAGGLDWRLILGLGAVPALIGLAFRTVMPESPRWLLRTGRYEKMQAALSRLGVDATIKQIRETAEHLAESEKRDRGTAGGRRWTRGVWRALIVVCVFFIFQQITGINIPLYYGPHILSPLLGGGSSTVQSAIASVEVTTIMAAVNVIASYFGFRYIDRIGRRRMSMGGYTGMAVSMLLSAAALTYSSGLAQVILVMIGLDGFIASFAIGVGGTGWILQGEVFPTEIRGSAAAIAASVDWLANYALIQAFPAWKAGIGLAGVMVCFAALSVLAILFIARFLPETKDIPVEEVIRRFEVQARS